MAALQQKTPQIDSAGEGQDAAPPAAAEQEATPGNAAENDIIATGDPPVAPPADPATPPGGPPAAQPAATTLTIRIQNEYSAGGATDRSTVGLAEKSFLDCGDMSGTWAVTGGAPAGRVVNGLYEWSAPMTAGTYTITYTQGTSVGTQAFTVVAPTGFSGDAPTPDAIASGQGVGMRLGVHMEPQSVAFNKLQWIEDSVPATNLTGYFNRPGFHPPGHGTAQGAGHWLTMGNNNSTSDHASFAGARPPWKDTSAAHAWDGGSFTWAISTKYRLGSSGSPIAFVTNDQVMSIDDGTTGASTVSKFGQSTSRTP